MTSLTDFAYRAGTKQTNKTIRPLGGQKCDNRKSQKNEFISQILDHHQVNRPDNRQNKQLKVKRLNMCVTVQLATP